jgi:competence protein ComEC
VWWSFGSLPLVGLLANLLLVPVGSLLLLMAAGHALIACTASALAPLTAACLTLLARAFLRGSSACNAIDPHFVLPVLSLPQGIAVGLGTCALLQARHVRTQLCVLAATLTAYLGAELYLRIREQPNDSLRVTFLDVGQGDAALLDLPSGQLMVIDGGGNPQGGPDPGVRVLLPLLAARRRASIDVAVLTHPHPDHYGGLTALLAELPVKQLWDSGQARVEAELNHTSQAADELVRLARARGTFVRSPAELCGAVQRFGAAKVHVISPCPAFDSGFDPNDNSLVLRVEYAGRSLLFTGDIEAHAESQLLARGADLRAEVLKVPHHGSRTSSSEALLRAVQPSVAIVSAGAVNQFGHPHPEVMARLSRLVPRVIDLGEHGGTTVTIDRGGAMRVESVLP